MNLFEAKQAVFDCQVCAGRMVPDVVVDDSDLGFSVPTLTCNKCGDIFRNTDSSTEELLGL